MRYLTEFLIVAVMVLLVAGIPSMEFLYFSMVYGIPAIVVVLLIALAIHGLIYRG